MDTTFEGDAFDGESPAIGASSVSAADRELLGLGAGDPIHHNPSDEVAQLEAMQATEEVDAIVKTLLALESRAMDEQERHAKAVIEGESLALDRQTQQVYTAVCKDLDPVALNDTKRKESEIEFAIDTAKPLANQAVKKFQAVATHRDREKRVAAILQHRTATFEKDLSYRRDDLSELRTSLAAERSAAATTDMSRRRLRRDREVQLAALEAEGNDLKEQLTVELTKLEGTGMALQKANDAAAANSATNVGAINEAKRLQDQMMQHREDQAALKSTVDRLTGRMLYGKDPTSANASPRRASPGRQASPPPAGHTPSAAAIRAAGGPAPSPAAPGPSPAEPTPRPPLNDAIVNLKANVHAAEEMKAEKCLVDPSLFLGAAPDAPGSVDPSDRDGAHRAQQTLNLMADTIENVADELLIDLAQNAHERRTQRWKERWYSAKGSTGARVTPLDRTASSNNTPVLQTPLVPDFLAHRAAVMEAALSASGLPSDGAVLSGAGAVDARAAAGAEGALAPGNTPAVSREVSPDGNSGGYHWAQPASPVSSPYGNSRHAGRHDTSRHSNLYYDPHAGHHHQQQRGAPHAGAPSLLELASQHSAALFDLKEALQGMNLDQQRDQQRLNVDSSGRDYGSNPIDPRDVSRIARLREDEGSMALDVVRRRLERLKLETAESVELLRTPLPHV